MTKMIYCCNCKADVEARLTTGSEIYPEVERLAEYQYWTHDLCGGHVGTDATADDPTTPLGCIPSDEIKKVRQAVSALIEPIWKSKIISRAELYKRMSKDFGREFNIADIRSEEEGDLAMSIARKIEDGFNAPKLENTEDLVRIAREADSGYVTDDAFEIY